MSTHLTKTEIQIFGIRDNGCRERLAEMLEGLEGVEEANVSLIRARAVVLHDSSCSKFRLMKAIREAGYVASAED